jgi:glycosyltransferase involved in cell wall biosynthesis
MANTLTVLAATRNGEAVLGQTLTAFAAAERPEMPWQMVVVDNGSTDTTRNILDEHAARLPLRVVAHPTPGKNAALNAALEACDGDLIVIVDDDVLPDRNFLRAWSRYLNERTEHALLGGRIAPYFEVPPPGWLLKDRRHYALMFGERDLPEGPTEPGEIYGGNMAVRRSVFDSGFRFDDAIGPNRDNPNYRMGSETEFLRRVGRSGATAWFAQQPLVHHIVRERQWSERAWIDRAYRNGLGRAHLMLKEGRQMRPPQVTLADRLAALSPFAAHRLPALSALHLARGFADEIAATKPK